MAKGQIIEVKEDHVSVRQTSEPSGVCLRFHLFVTYSCGWYVLLFSSFCQFLVLCEREKHKDNMLRGIAKEKERERNITRERERASERERERESVSMFVCIYVCMSGVFFLCVRPVCVFLSRFSLSMSRSLFSLLLFLSVAISHLPPSLFLSLSEPHPPAHPPTRPPTRPRTHTHTKDNFQRQF